MRSSTASYSLEKWVRRLLLEALPIDELKAFARKVGRESDGKPFDIALNLAGIQWRVGSSLVWHFAEAFSIPLEFLPARTSRDDAMELVEPYTPTPPLFDYQQELASGLLRLLDKDERGACLVQLPTGAGKTRTAMAAITGMLTQRKPSHRTAGVLWLAHTEELCQQAIESFRSTWQTNGNSDMRIVRFWGDYNVKPLEMTGAVVFASYQKAVSLKGRSVEEFETFRKHFGVIVADEAHRALAPTVADLLAGLQDNSKVFLIGLTATPGRGEGQAKENRQLAELFDRRLLSAKHLGEDPIQTLQQRGILAKINHVDHATEVDVDLTDREQEQASFTSAIPTSVLNRLAKNKKRNELIASIVVNQIERGGTILVFACSVEHSKSLAAELALRGYRAAAIDCRMRRSLRRRTVNAFKDGEIDVLFNFGVLSTGFDAPNITAVLIARPTSSIVLYSQMIGRGLRGHKVGGTEDCLLIDLKDNFENFGDVGRVYSYFDQFWRSGP